MTDCWQYCPFTPPPVPSTLSLHLSPPPFPSTSPLHPQWWGEFYRSGFSAQYITYPKDVLQSFRSSAFASSRLLSRFSNRSGSNRESGVIGAEEKSHERIKPSTNSDSGMLSATSSLKVAPAMLGSSKVVSGLAVGLTQDQDMVRLR